MGALTPPVVILARPQLGENIGAAARAMKNCGLTDLRLVEPRDGWPNLVAFPMAAAGKDIIESAKVYKTLGDALHDVTFLVATSARPRDMAKPVSDPRSVAPLLVGHHEQFTDSGRYAGLLFGAERSGLDNDELALADIIVQADLNPEATSLNLAQAVFLMAWEWRVAALHHLLMKCHIQFRWNQILLSNIILVNGRRGQCAVPRPIIFSKKASQMVPFFAFFS